MTKLSLSGKVRSSIDDTLLSSTQSTNWLLLFKEAQGLLLGWLCPGQELEQRGERAKSTSKGTGPMSWDILWPLGIRKPAQKPCHGIFWWWSTGWALQKEKQDLTWSWRPKCPVTTVKHSPQADWPWLLPWPGCLPFLPSHMESWVEMAFLPTLLMRTCWQWAFSACVSFPGKLCLHKWIPCPYTENSCCISLLIEAPSFLGPVKTMPGAIFVPTKQELDSLVLREWPGWKSPFVPAGSRLHDPPGRT